ncbi:MAG: tRNA1(Val) (adenine(37)-N6)-methyltransferase [Bacteroidia bacterium]
MSKSFQFKQFSLKQEKSAQRMSTDSMVLGAVAELGGAMNILDIGTGTGVLALMMAQKHPEALVDAVEIDPDSAAEATENFENSPWNYRLNCYAEPFQEFIRDETLHYDLIVTNPPYFDEILTQKGGNKEWPDEKRLIARTHSSLNFDGLIDGVDRVLVSYGRFFVILPIQAESVFIQKVFKKNLFLFYRLRLRHDAHSEVHRVILGFQKTSQELSENELVLRDAEGNWTESYTTLTAEFHLK